MFIIPAPRTSTAIEAIQVNPFTAEVVLRFTNGQEYKYSNVKRSKIINLLLQPNISFGFWVQDLKNNAVPNTGYTDRTGALCFEYIGLSPYAKRQLSYFEDAYGVN